MFCYLDKYTRKSNVKLKSSNFTWKCKVICAILELREQSALLRIFYSFFFSFCTKKKKKITLSHNVEKMYGQKFNVLEFRGISALWFPKPKKRVLEWCATVAVHFSTAQSRRPIFNKLGLWIYAYFRHFSWMFLYFLHISVFFWEGRR